MFRDRGYSFTGFRSQLPRDKLEQFFEEQFRRISTLIDEQIHLLATKHPQEHLVSASGPWLN
jgi:hypothetical protein